MVSGALLLNTNVLIYILNKTRPSASELITQASPEKIAISIVTWMEVLTGTSPVNDLETRELLNRFKRIELTEAIVDETIAVRKRSKLKLPDAVIYASALVTGRTLVTYNTRDFPLGTPSVRNPEA